MGNPRRLNQIDEPQTEPQTEYNFRKLTDAQISELANWFSAMYTNDDPSKVKSVPEFYRPTCAYIQMKALEIDLGDMTPWNMPRDLAEYYADIWLANRIGVLHAAKIAHEAKHNERRPLYDVDSPVKADRRGGHA